MRVVSDSAVALAPVGRPFKRLFERLGLPQVAAMLDLAPKGPVTAPRYHGPGTATASAAPSSHGGASCASH